MKVGGVFAALKGPQGEEELAEGKKAITLLGGEAGRCVPLAAGRRTAQDTGHPEGKTHAGRLSAPTAEK